MGFYPAAVVPPAMVQRVLVGYDESPQAEAALRHALETHPDAELHVLHVNDPGEWVFGDEMGAFYSESAYEAAQESAEALLEEAADVAAEAGASAETAVETGRAGNAIVDYAEEHDVDHVVVGSHGRRGLSRFLLGSVAESVVRRSPVSVTVIRTPRED